MSITHESDDLLILLSMVYVAWSDGRLTREELALIQAEVQDQGLDPSEVERVRDMICSPPTLAAIRALAADRVAAKSAVAGAWVSALTDHELSPQEEEAITALAGALGLETEDRREVRAFVQAQVERARGGAATEALYAERWSQPVPDPA
jgi:uncharacterized membrane protein YebE (DUF533 family)